MWCKRKHPTKKDPYGDGHWIKMPDEDPHDVPPLEWVSNPLYQQANRF